MIRHSGTGSGLASGLLVALVVLGPLPFGGVMPRDRAALELCAFLALAFALASHGRISHLRLVRLPLLALLAVAAFGLLQSLSWPAFVGDLLAPRLTELWRESGALLEPGASDALIPLSIAPAVSRQVALHWLAVAACLAAATLQGRERGARRLMILALVASGVLQIALGAEPWIDRRSQIWGVDVPGDPSRLRGTFVNPDNFSFFLALCVTSCASWVLWAVRRIFETKEAIEDHVMRAVPPIMLFCVLFVGLAFSGSRGGLLAVVGALVIQGLVVALRYRRWTMAALAAAPLALAAGGLALFGWRRGLARWLETSLFEVTWNARLETWRASLELWWQMPLTGTGLGTFRQAYPLVQPTDLPGTWRHAHSDIVELLVTLGVASWALLALAIFGLATRLLQLHRRGRRSEDRAAGLAALGVASAAFLHSGVDFSLTLPANAFATATMLGLACGTLTLERREKASRGPGETVFMDRDAESKPYGEEEARADPAAAVSASGR
ncbi:MAG: O-antigen ligase family protein [Acidobacteriota bacterium]